MSTQAKKGGKKFIWEWMDNIDCLDGYAFDKLANMEVDGESPDYIDEDPRVLMLKEEGTHWKLVAIVEATTELKNWAWKGATHPMEDPLEKIKITEPFTPAKSIVSTPIESTSASIVIPIKSIPIASILVESIKNSAPYNIISNSTYFLALNVFILEISKETFNNEELKQQHVEPIKEETQSINLGTDDEPKMVQIGNTITSSEKDALVTLLKEFKEEFALSYKDIPGIDIDRVQHCIHTNLAMKPIKQKLRRIKPKWTFKINEKVEKEYNAGFLRVVNYLEWLANMVLVPKKDRRVRICVNLRDLNKASPKDNFPLPHIDIMVDNMARHALLLFMDSFLGYNQINITLEDILHYSMGDLLLQGHAIS